jgi:hypothetical protein
VCFCPLTRTVEKSKPLNRKSYQKQLTKCKKVNNTIKQEEKKWKN